MAAITKRLLHVRPNSYSYSRPHPYPVLHFSSSSDSDAPQPDPNPPAQTRSPLTSTLSDVRTGLYPKSPPQNRHQIPRTPPPSTDETHRLLSEFRSRSAAPPPSSSGSLSLQALFEKNVNPNGKDSHNPSGFNVGVKRSMDMIRSSLPGRTDAQNEIAEKVFNRWSKVTEPKNPKADANANQGSTMLTGRKDDFLPSFLRMDLGLMRDHKELGDGLKKLRPENKKGKWFSLQELSGRVAKLKEAGEKERETMGSTFHGLRAGIAKQREKEQKPPITGQTLSYLGIVGGTQAYDLLPPKNDLVEKYFHPDNMSSAEKLKLELKKVRDEFKMSESDCGSARVQVAQLTTKIKHLSTVLMKKDKHSRRGLQAMVQRRKKLLKYLRRTDWDSYCLVLSKFGFRDNPDVKA